MAERVRVVIADDLKLQREMMKAALASSERFALVGEASTGSELVEIAKREKPDLVLTDLHMPVLDGAQALRILSFALPTCVFVVFSGEDDIEKLRPVISAGASDFLRKPLQMNRLLDAIEAIYDREAPRKRAVHHHAATTAVQQGKILGVTAAQAGAGSSLVAANLAAGLVRAKPRIALVDFDFQSAASTARMGVRNSHTILDMFQTLDQVEWASMKNFMISAHGVSVLAGPPFPIDAARRDPEVLVAVLEVLAAEFDVVVVDIEPRIDETNTVLIGKADHVLLTVPNDPVGVAAAGRWMQVYSHSNPPRDKLKMIYCHSRGLGVIPGGELAGAVGVGIFSEVGHDPANALTSWRDGKPAVEDAGTPLGKSLRDMVDKVYQRLVEPPQDGAQAG